MKPCREPELRRQLRTIVRVWEGRQGRESAKLAVLSALADHFGDLGDPELVTENRRLRQQLKALQARRTGPPRRKPGLVEQIRRASLAQGAPVAKDDLQALESLLRQGSRRTAEALGALLVERARQAAQEPVVVEEATSLDPRPRKATRAEAEDGLFELGLERKRGRSK